MSAIPLNPADFNDDFLSSLTSFPLKLVRINNPGDYDTENILFVATEDIESLYSLLLFYSVEEVETGLPAYDKCRWLDFDELELQEGDLLQVYTKPGEDKTTFDSEAEVFYNVVHWGLTQPIWHIPHSSFELMKRSESYSAAPIL